MGPTNDPLVSLLETLVWVCSVFFLNIFSGGQTNILRNRGGHRLQHKLKLAKAWGGGGGMPPLTPLKKPWSAYEMLRAVKLPSQRTLHDYTYIAIAAAGFSREIDMHLMEAANLTVLSRA